ncbi:PD-(D/E)XK nuclease family protein [Salinibacterium sp. SWN248]|uniref:PD-(D/E)XK nuclease family protein n=1 Tax=Salinibacterium sp. SWN248 TaxID=2792056 RepID=UPI0018CDDBEA|nr:PD-(D/E)XK nuclease family protein [Salinibacterium sp. SWN248]MBH0024439.1 PD-(D/E)XK nuclease family protein [Salinibacterium sp. SWN248]
MTLDLSFLEVSLRPAGIVERPVNVYDILREGWRETRVDMTLQFFLDPTERHGLGTLVIDALLRLLDGAPSIGLNGRTSKHLIAQDAEGSDAWEVATQVDFIDVFASNRDSGIALVLENKIGHVLDNPLRKYAEYARNKGFDTVIVAVLAPEARDHPDPVQKNYLSSAITYAELSAEIKSAPELVEFLMSPGDRDQRRSLELLQQFIEARHGKTEMTDLEDQAQRLDEWRDVLEEHRGAITAFEEARSSIGRLIRDRRKRLEPLITDRLEALALETGWQAHGGGKEETWNAYHFPAADWSVELKFSADPTRPMIFVYDRRGLTYKDSTIEPLGLTWTNTDERIADAFIERVVHILGEVKAGTRLPAGGHETV